MGAAEWCQRPVPRRPTGSTQDLGISGLQHWAPCLLVGRPLCSPSFFSGPGLGAEWAGVWVRWAWAPTPEAAERWVGMPTAEGSLQPRGLTTAGFLTWTLLCAPLGPGRPPPPFSLRIPNPRLGRIRRQDLPHGATWSLVTGIPRCRRRVSGEKCLKSEAGRWRVPGHVPAHWRPDSKTAL